MVVAVSPPLRFETVPYAKPDSRASEPPVEVMEPFRTEEDCPTEFAGLVETEAGPEQIEVVKVASAPYAGPPEFTAYART